MSSEEAKAPVKTSGADTEVAPQQPDAPAILMVDDQPARLLTYEAILTGMPVQCVRAHSGEEALQLLLKQSFALILLDVNMPGMDGFEVARHVRSHPRLGRMPIVFVSGERFSDLDRLKGYEVGAIDYIGVPVVPEILRSKVALLIELFNRRSELEQINRATVEAKTPRQSARDREGATLENLRALFEQTSDCKFILRAERAPDGVVSDWRYVDVNESALRMVNRARDAIVGKTIREAFPERDKSAGALCLQALAGGEGRQYETEYGGQQLLTRVFGIGNDCVAVTCTNVTDRRRIESALANSEGRFQALLEGCPVGVAQNSPDGRFEYVNAGFCDIVGYTAEELSRLTWHRLRIRTI